jgi:TIR domain
MAGKIFISYRRDDDPAFAARVHEGLGATFGKSNLFMNIDNLIVGQRFDKELAKALTECDVLIAIIGRHWVQSLRDKIASGERDYVREEIAEALKREIAVVPTPVGPQGHMPAPPRPDDLPTPNPAPPSSFGKLIKDETDKWTKVVRLAGIKAQ